MELKSPRTKKLLHTTEKAMTRSLPYSAADIARAALEGAEQREHDIIKLLEDSALGCCPLDAGTCPRNKVIYDSIQRIKNKTQWKEDK